MVPPLFFLGLGNSESEFRLIRDMTPLPPYLLGEAPLSKLHVKREIKSKKRRSSNKGITSHCLLCSQ